MAHEFIFQPQLWMGEGTITLNMVEEEMSFFTKWSVLGKDDAGKISGTQEIQIGGISEEMKNRMTFYEFHDKGFSIEMENPSVGCIVGKGLFDEKMVAWEFRNNEQQFEGFETYFLQPDGSYTIHSEYVTTDQFRTLIRGRIWKATGGEK